MTATSFRPARLARLVETARCVYDAFAIDTNEVAAQIGVSQDTARDDLKALEAHGVVCGELQELEPGHLYSGPRGRAVGKVIVWQPWVSHDDVDVDGHIEHVIEKLGLSGRGEYDRLVALREPQEQPLQWSCPKCAAKVAAPDTFCADCKQIEKDAVLVEQQAEYEATLTPAQIKLRAYTDLLVPAIEDRDRAAAQVVAAIEETIRDLQSAAAGIKAGHHSSAFHAFDVPNLTNRLAPAYRYAANAQANVKLLEDAVARAATKL